LSNFFKDNALSFLIIDAKPGEHTSVPGKLMGYACLGEYDEKIETWLVENNYFKEYWDKPQEILSSIKTKF
jgi:carbamoyltransferase